MKRQNVPLLPLLITFMLAFSSEAQTTRLTNITLRFDGKLVDQDGKPVVGAQVSLETRADYFEENRSESTRYNLQSDQDGNFEINGAFGSSVNILSITKEGYQFSPKAKRSYIYTWGGDVFHPDPKNPVVFKMWKTAPPEPLAVGSVSYKSASEDGLFTIDLLNHEAKPGISLSGDLVVRITRPKNIPPRAKYDWSYSIEAIDGGVIHTNSEFMYQAPEAGYEAKYDFSATATNTHWFGGVRGEQFYVKSRGGKAYGSLDVEVIPDYNGGSMFKVYSVVNPAGSRNLQPEVKP